MKTSFLNLLLLLMLVSCSTPSKEKKSIKHVGHSENYRSLQSEMIFKRVKKDPKNDELIKAYFNFYAYSLRNICGGLQYESTYPGNDLLHLPGIRYGEIKAAQPTDENAIAADFFDLTNLEDGQRYEFFSITTEISQWEYSGKVKPSGPEKNLVLLKTGSPNAIKYVVCSDKLGANLLCAQDKVIAQMADVNNNKGLCELMRSRKPSISEDKLLYAIIDLLVQLEIIHEPIMARM